MKYFKKLLVYIAIITAGNIYGQNFSWMNSAGGTFDDISGKVVRGTNSYFLYGNFDGNVTLTNTQSGNPIQLTNHGWGSDIFLINVDTLGEVIWAKSFGSNGIDSVMGSIRFNYDDSTVTLIGTHTSDFYYGSNPSDFISLYNGAGQSVAFLKIKENGNVLKVNTTTEFGIGFQYLNDVQQSSSDIILSGLFSGDLNFSKKNGSGDTTITGPTFGSGAQAFVVSLDNNLKLNFVTKTPQYIYKMEIDSVGNIYGVGSYEWSVDSTFNSTWYLNTSLIKISPSGTLRYAKRIKTKSISYAKYSYLNIISDNNISFTTLSSDTTFFDNVNLYTSPLSTWSTHPQFEYFSLRLDSVGNLTNLFPYQIGTTMFYGIDFNMNKLKESYFTLPFSNTVTANGNTYTSNGGTDVLLYAFDANANINWVQSFGSVGFDYCNSITFDKANNPVLHGTFESTIIIPDVGGKNTSSLNITSNGGKDVFYAKINRDDNITTGISNSKTQTANWSLYPNPASKKVYIKLNEKNSNYKFELFNTLGQKVYECNITSEVEEINVSKYEAGVYTYNIYNQNQKLSGKLVIVN